MIYKEVVVDEHVSLLIVEKGRSIIAKVTAFPKDPYSSFSVVTTQDTTIIKHMADEISKLRSELNDIKYGPVER